MWQHLIIKHISISLMKCMNIHTKQDKYRTTSRLMSVQSPFCPPGSLLQMSENVGCQTFGFQEQSGEAVITTFSTTLPFTWETLQ